MTGPRFPGRDDVLCADLRPSTATKVTSTDPDASDPTRFTPEAGESRPRCAYMPWAPGPRICRRGIRNDRSNSHPSDASPTYFTLGGRQARRRTVGSDTLRPQTTLHLRVAFREKPEGIETSSTPSFLGWLEFVAAHVQVRRTSVQLIENRFRDAACTDAAIELLGGNILFAAGGSKPI